MWFLMLNYIVVLGVIFMHLACNCHNLSHYRLCYYYINHSLIGCACNQLKSLKLNVSSFVFFFFAGKEMGGGGRNVIEGIFWGRGISQIRRVG